MIEPRSGTKGSGTETSGLTTDSEPDQLDILATAPQHELLFALNCLINCNFIPSPYQPRPSSYSNDAERWNLCFECRPLMKTLR